MRVKFEHTATAFLLVFFLAIGLLSYTTQLSASANDEQEQQIGTLPPVLVVPLLGPTATRTPTPINVGNFVWDDIDQDGRQDAGEPGMAGITVQLWNSSKTQLIAQTVTGGNGNYSVVAPLPGQYRIRVVLPNFMDSFTTKDQANGDDQLDSDINSSGTNIGFSDTYNFASNLISITTIDAGIRVFRTPTPTRTPTPINVGNFVWDDIDQDGRQDAGEPGISNVTVQLWNSAKTQLLGQTTTNASGNYSLIAPLPGNYRVRVILPNLMDSFTTKDQAGGDDLLDSDINSSGSNIGFTDTYNFASNLISITTIDAGIRKFRTPTPTRTPTPINLGNFVWNDFDHDGQQDAGEPGVAGITVQLWNSGITQLIGQTVTNSSGNYTLIAPLPGNYRIAVLLPGPMDAYTFKDLGADTSDSDINSGNALHGFTDVISIASNVISISSIDAGIRLFQTPTPPPVIVQPVASLVLQIMPSATLPVLQIMPSATLPVLIVPIATLPSIDICAGFRLTSPLDGLPDGVARFYWDPANARGVSYQITLLDEGRNVLATYTTNDVTSIDGDVSRRAIGGNFQLIVQVSALVNGRVACTDERTILRAAPNLEVPPLEIRPPEVIPTATPRRRG